MCQEKGVILIVEDNVHTVQLLMTILQKYNVLVSTTGMGALDIIKTKKIDLIILDIILPDMNGFQICEELKIENILHKIPIIFLSGDDTIETKSKAFKHGAVDYICKPFQKDELILRVQAQLEKIFEFEEEISQLEKDRNTISEKMSQLEKCLKKTKQVENNFRSIVELMPAPVFVCDYRSDKIVYVNPAFCKMTGYTEKELLDNSVDMLIPPEAIEKRSMMKNSMTDEQLEQMMGAARSHKMWIVHKDNELVFIPAIFYNWRNNGDRFITMIFTETIQPVEYNAMQTDLKLSMEEIEKEHRIKYKGTSHE